MKQSELSRWLRVVVVIGWAACALLSAFVAPSLAHDAAEMAPELSYLAWPCLAIFWLGMIPIVVALGYAWRIFTEIGRDNSFCRENARRLRAISRLALMDTVLCLACIVALLVLGALHPGVLLLMLLIAVIGAGVTVATAALSHLTMKAAQMQSEQELTI